MTTAAPQLSTQPTRWTLDASHSSVGFSVRHLMITNVRGEFGKLSGSAAYDPTRPEAATVSATIDVASINTREEKRDEHLKSADFLDVEKFPTITFESRGVERSGDGLRVVGALTIHGRTRQVTLEVGEVTHEGSDPWGNTRIGATASTRIKRSDFGMTWNSTLETGGVLVGDEIRIQIDVSLVKQA
jgi:polyisoprenoid-binding protein YceI